MDTNVITQEVTRAADQYSVEIVANKRQLHEAYNLRYQVYCLERGFEPGQDGEEIDEFDVHSKHVLLRDLEDGTPVGNVRVVMADPANLGDSFPMQRLCAPSLMSHLPLLSTGEMSRLALSKQRKSGRANIMLLRLLLWRGFLEVSSEAKLTHWLAVAEPSNIRLHARHAIHFEPIGPLVSHHGMRQPLAGKIETMLETVRREAFPVWNFITDGGRLFGVQRRELEAV